MFESLPGFREFLPEACARRNFIFAQWRESCRKFGFEEFDGPVLEPLELYLEKSGEEIVGQLFHFMDKGGRQVALRPEMTPTLARMIGARANSIKRPVKWFAVAENFRYERPQKGRLRSHYQLNADIYGEPGVGAEAELLALLVEVFTGLGLTAEDVRLRVSDRELWMGYLRGRGWDEALCRQILGVVDRMEKQEEAETRKALAGLVGEREAGDLWEKIREIVTLRDLAGLERWAGGSAETAARFQAWTELLETCAGLGIGDFVQIDLGIVRGLAYYTGFVFEAFERAGGRALAGGGRYDNLVQKLGGPAMPAVGFGLGDVTLGDALEARGLLPARVSPLDCYVVHGATPAERKAALDTVHRLRRAGLGVEYPFRPGGFGKQFKDASQKGARVVVVIGEAEAQAAQATVKAMATGEETRVPMEGLLAAVWAAAGLTRQA